MTPLRIFSRATLLLVFVPALAAAQALTSITSLFVAYNTRKVTTNPTGELKARLDSVDREMFAANRVGRMGEVRRLLAKGNTLLAGRPWTDVADYNASLLLRGDVVVESQKPFALRLEQLYAPAIELTRSLTATAALVVRPVAAAGTAGAPQPLLVVKELGNFDGVSRDLRDSPFAMEFEVRGVSDGRYLLRVEVQDSTRVLGTVLLPVALKKGLDETVSRLEAEAARAPVGLRAEILYPVDRMRNVNRGRLELRTLDIEKDFAAADAVVAAVKAKKDPFAGRTGDLKRHYLLESAHEVMPYRMYVPTSYSPRRAAPLIIALHGLGGTEDAFFDSYGKKLPELAEARGYIVAAPLGYRVDGGYGYGVGAPSADPLTRRAGTASEEDVMQVLAQVKKLYTIDEDRVFLMGHSMGAIGTWKLAAKFPEPWAALGLFSGMGAPATVDRFRQIPQFVVHGDADPTVNVAGSRAMVAALKALNADVTYVEVPGGNHLNVVEPNFGAMFDFFATRRRGGRPAP